MCLGIALGFFKISHAFALDELLNLSLVFVGYQILWEETSKVT
jgi:hypothetical protein